MASAFAKLKQQSAANLKVLAEKVGQEKTKGNFSDDRFWNPDVDKTGTGMSIIRFLPAIEGEDSPFVKVYSHGFKNLMSGKWFIDNCPTTIGRTDCPVNC
jgi:hypothetical protein